MDGLARFNSALGKLIDVLCWVVMSALILIVSFQVANRFIIRVPAAWTEEFSRYIFVWLSLIGSVKGVKDKAHLGVDMLVLALKGKTRAIVELIAFAIALVFFCLLGVTGWNYAAKNVAVLNDTGNISMFVVYVSIPVACALAVPILLEDVLKAFKGVTRA